MFCGYTVMRLYGYAVIRNIPIAFTNLRIDVISQATELSREEIEGLSPAD